MQEALLRLHRALEGGERIESPRAYVADRGHPAGDRRAALGPGPPRDLRRRVAARAARRRPAEDDPARHAEIADSLSLAFLVLLESLSPEQRAVFLLREVFDYPYDRDRRDRRQERGQRAPARGPGAPPRRGAPAALRAPRASSATSWPAASSPPPSEGDLDGARGAARRGRRAARRRRRQGAGARAAAVHGRARVAGRCAPGRAAAPRVGGRRVPRRVEVNGQPGAHRARRPRDA